MPNYSSKNVIGLKIKIGYIDYVQVCNRFLDCNNKNVSKVKETKDKKLCNVLPRNMVDHFDTCQEPEQVRFNFSSYNLFGDEKGALHKD